MRSTQEWAETEFGGADLGDARRSRRLVRLAAEVARRPAGTVTRACSTGASREGAFRLLENPAVKAEAMREAMHAATADRCRDQAVVFVPVDATSLTVTDRTRNKGLGAVGSWTHGSRGVHAMTAFAVAEDGSSLGVCAQRMWVREQRSPHGRHHSRAGHGTESEHWLDVLYAARSTLGAVAPQCTPWFQMDRGADCWQVLALAHQLDMLVTVRAVHDRCLDGQVDGLWDTLLRARVVATLGVDVPTRPPAVKRRRVGANRRITWRTAARPARKAKLTVRATAVPVVLKTREGRSFTVPLHAVLVKETARAVDPVEWMLLTTHPVNSRADALAVVRGYTMRWRIEELHRTWKRGLCRVEDTQLRSREAVFKWATILVAVASRAMRLTQLARSSPDAEATAEFSSFELAALLALREPKGFDRNAVPTLAQAVRWLADLGGYTGPWNGPPGATVIGRGLRDILVTARALENLGKKR